jgi:hypothetical protein
MFILVSKRQVSNRNGGGAMSNDEWKTPGWLMRHFKGHYDPCPEKPTENGLEVGWETPAFVNPPYSNPLAWVRKAILESNKGVDVVMLLRVDPSTRWYKELVEANAHFCYFNERLKFNDADGSSNFASMLVCLEAGK